MPDRILRESICISDTIDKLSWFEEVFFYRLTVICDDFGRFDARPKILKNRLFPLKDDLTLKAVGDALSALSTVGLVQVYSYDQKPYLQLKTWERYQRRRAAKSKYPGPDNTCCQLTSSYSDSQQVLSNAPVFEFECESDIREGRGNSPRFTPPKLDEVKAYCLERNRGIDPEKWYDFYQSKGWMVGKNKMKDWKAAVRTWEKTNAEPPTKSRYRDMTNYNPGE